MPYAISTEPLAQMLRSINLQKRTGLLRVEQFGDSSQEQGEVYFESGRLIRAQAGQDSGRVALNRISSWKHITCSFDGVNRPYPGHLSPQISSKEPNTGKDYLTHMSPSTSSPIATQQHSPSPVSPETTPQHVPGAFSSRTSGSPTTEPVSAASVNLRASIPSGRVTQPFFLHETQQQDVPRMSRPSGTLRAGQPSISRPLPVTPLPEMPRKLPATPLPSSGPLPGRMAIFKPVPMANSAKSIQRLERRDRVVFILLDGSRTIRDIAQLMHYTEEEVEQVLIRLTQRGYTERVSAQRLFSHVHEKMVGLFANAGQNEPD